MTDWIAALEQSGLHANIIRMRDEVMDKFVWRVEVFDDDGVTGIVRGSELASTIEYAMDQQAYRRREFDAAHA